MGGKPLPESMERLILLYTDGDAGEHRCLYCGADWDDETGRILAEDEAEHQTEGEPDGG